MTENNTTTSPSLDLTRDWNIIMPDIHIDGLILSPLSVSTGPADDQAIGENVVVHDWNIIMPGIYIDGLILSPLSMSTGPAGDQAIGENLVVYDSVWTSKTTYPCGDPIATTVDYTQFGVQPVDSPVNFEFSPTVEPHP
ncbi:unnamed protein product [Adineta ricciae]|uniref:Uncharacterized protein n=1 Tax=Adineta ricciae TaxID=249248 RepID=A0A814JPV0_ADIRI|nr:unnamed protein product [Adineta ricciae]